MLGISAGLSLTALFSASWWESIMFMAFMGGLVVFSSGANECISSVEIEMDYLGAGLVLLSVWVVCLSGMSSQGIYNNKSMFSGFLMMMSALLTVLSFSFSVSDYMVFYIGFESCLIPITAMILGWGYQPERSTAGVYMMFYTLFGSFPLFYMLVFYQMEFGSSYMYGFDSMSGISGVGLIFVLGAFLVKFPMYGVHLWLYKAHVEAPVGGSMVLAGVLLKLGGYGIIRILWGANMSNFISGSVIISVSLWGGVVVSIMCMRQMDMKLLIAASSVVHMSVCLGGLFVVSELGLKGAYIMMIAHGLSSSGLFFLANSAYERTHSRSMSVNKGLLNICPVMALGWFLLISSNMAAPPSINLLSEVMLLSGVINWSYFSVACLSVISLFSVAYSVFLFSLSQHGKFSYGGAGFSSGQMLEGVLVLLHWLPLNMIILFGGYIF